MPSVALRACLLLLAALAFAPRAQGRVLEMRVEAVQTAFARADGVNLRLDWPAGAEQGELELAVAALDAGQYGYRFRDLRWRCPLRREAETWRCSGPVVSGGGGPAHELALEIAPERLHGEFGRGPARVRVQRETAAPDTLAVVARRIPVEWVEAYLQTLWADGSFGDGLLDGRFRVEVAADTPLALQGELDVEGLAFDTPDGLFAGEALDARLHLGFRGEPRQALSVEGVLLGGDFLAGGFFVTLPDTPVDVALHGTREGRDGWRFDRLAWRDGRALVVDGDLRLTPDMGLEALTLQLDSRDLARATPRYLDSVLGLAGLGGLQLNGGAHARLRMDAGGPLDLLLRLDDVGAGHPDGRFGSDGLDGSIAWTADGERHSRLTWRGVSLLGVPMLSADLRLRSVDGLLALSDSADIAMLGGNLHLETLAIRPPLRGRDAEGAFAVRLEGLDIAQLADWMDWPPFTGRLDGDIPGVRYTNGRLIFDGNLVLDLFDGTVRINHLVMERPFGVAPTLGASIGIDGLDLRALTGVFGVGEITGALDGYINGLRLVDWSVVAFDAALWTDDAWPGRRRVSQRAVRGLTSVGGGLASGAQSLALGFFEDFGYRRIGLSCRLVRGVCHMEGIGSSGDGYTIVQGSGLPNLRVVGFNRRVDWPALVDSIQGALDGDTPTID